jgi:hypothetical protein
VHSRLANRLLLGIAAGLTIVIAGYLYWEEHQTASWSAAPPPSKLTLAQPQLLPASRLWLADQTQIIGVTAAGKHRAYPVGAITGLTTEPVHDVIGEVAVTLTHCLKADHYLVFTADQGGSPQHLRLVQPGAEENLLTGIVAGGPPPSPRELTAILTTWKNWKETYPDTDVHLRREF